MIRVNLGRRFRSSKTMILNGFQLGNLTKSENTEKIKIGIEIDPGASRERRKQCTFEVQFV